jgi:hypothetical protein
MGTQRSPGAGEISGAQGIGLLAAVRRVHMFPEQVGILQIIKVDGDGGLGFSGLVYDFIKGYRARPE